MEKNDLTSTPLTRPMKRNFFKISFFHKEQLKNVFWKNFNHTKVYGLLHLMLIMRSMIKTNIDVLNELNQEILK